MLSRRSSVNAAQATEREISNPDEAILKMTPGLRTENVCVSNYMQTSYTYHSDMKGDYIPIANLKDKGRANVIAVVVSVQKLKLTRTGGML